MRKATVAVTMIGTAWFVGVPSPHAAAQGGVRITPGAVQVSGGAVEVPTLGVEAPSYTCTVNILYVPNSGTSETYQKVFELAVGSTFVDDFSTALREHVFTAGATQQGAEVLFDVDYFSDVSTFNAIDLETSLTMRTNQMAESHTGRQRFFTSSPGGYSLTYTIDCVKN